MLQIPRLRSLPPRRRLAYGLPGTNAMWRPIMVKRTPRRKARKPGAARPVAAPQGDPLLRLKQVKKQIPYSSATIYRKIAEGKFPPGFKLGPNSRAWFQSTIDRWKAEREAAAE